MGIAWFLSRSRVSLVLLLLFFTVTNVRAQIVPHLVYQSHPYKDETNQTIRGTGTLTIVAVMVDFQKDDNPYTSGNGLFNTSIVDTNASSYFSAKDVKIDPLPHNRAYFEAHLKFAQNYFETVSGGKLKVNYLLLPKIYQLNNKMAAYSPLGNDNSQDYKLADLLNDTWTAVQQSGGFDTSGLDPNHTIFVIFHAGTGREFDFRGTALDHTPQDIPSIFLDHNTISNLLKQPGFTGFPIGNSGFHITNSAIIPETESHLATDIAGTRYLVEFSINGLLCATIGNYLGLPDLYNTKTGNSGIGQFGLMDPSSFFAYQGLFPPEPSAWEKIRLGWANSFNVSLNDTTPIKLPASSLHEPNSVARYNISRDEYFLVENRYRDPSQKGLDLTIQQPNGSVTVQHIGDNDAYFNNSYPDSIIAQIKAGTVVGVNDYDWALPGGVDAGPDNEVGTNDDRLLMGGQLIWHIDDGVIRTQEANDAINNNPDRKGVNLMEADGSQDIGRNIPNLFFQDAASGTPYDFWWKGNNASVITQAGDTLRLYQNRFADDTHPNNRSNTGSPTFFEFYDFSNTRLVATFRAKPASSGWFSKEALNPSSPLPDGTGNNPKGNNAYPLGLRIYSSPTDTFLIVPSYKSVYAVGLSGNQKDKLTDFQFPYPSQPLIDGQLVLGRESGTGNHPAEAWQPANGQWAMIWENKDVTSVPALISSENGDTLQVDLTGKGMLASDGSTVIRNIQDQRSKKISGTFSSIEDGSLSLSDNSYNESLSNSNRLYTGAVQINATTSAFFALLDNSFQYISLKQNSDLFQSSRTLQPVEGVSLDWPALTDFNDDGTMDLVYVNKTDNTLEALNPNGSFLNSFPLSAPAGSHFVGTPLIVNLDGNSGSDLLVGATDSISYVIHGYNPQMHELPGFPLYVGGLSDSTHSPVEPVFFDHTLYAVSPAGDVKAWSFPKSGEPLWGSLYGNGKYNKVYSFELGKPAVTGTAALLNVNETYNWPNPANELTHLRVQTSKSADVTITIITMTGRMLYQKHLRTSAGVPSEIQLTTSQWGSGAYYARVHATDGSRSGSKLVKIAVIH
ncbi:MAG TPA: T9SS type A sorting domain-containing protein [Balneolales bacterium]|nr:T9SS type A sorting domain-containing protein [Balneolales bacterium]